MLKHTEINWDTIPEEKRDIMRQVYEILDLAKFDYERSQLNTVVSGCMKLLNLLVKLKNDAPSEMDAYMMHLGMSILLRLLCPIAPHITHQLWQDLDYKGSIQNAAWPKCNATALKMDQMELVVQINGKLRTRIKVPSQADEKTIQNIAIQDAKVQQTIADKAIKKMIVVPGRLVNIVIGEK